jgi:hypothetical protein
MNLEKHPSNIASESGKVAELCIPAEECYFEEDKYT